MLEGLDGCFSVCCLLALLVKIVADINFHRQYFKQSFPWTTMRSVRLSRAALAGDEELMAMWSFLQLSCSGTVNFAAHAPQSAVCKGFIM